MTRYIHLNPLRARLVEDLKSLDKYPWSGHSTILGRRKNPLIPETVANGSTSAGRRIAFSQFRPGIEKATTNPENPVDPVKNKSLAEKTIEDVLQYFGKSLKEARRKYRQFVEKGIKHGRREDLQGGGLIRPACHARPENIWKEQVVGIVHMVEEASREVRHERAGAAGVTRQGC